MHGRDVDAKPPRAFGIVAESIELAPGGGMPDQHPGGDDADRHDRHRQRQLGPVAVGLLELEQHRAMRPPFGQIVDRHAMREEHQQAEEDVERRDRDDDRDDAEIVDQGGIDGAERYACDGCDGEPAQPAAAADFASASATTYWTTDAATANEMSMPPAISTTSSPTAKIRLIELVLSRLKRLAMVKNLSLVIDRPAQITSRTTTSHVSVGWARTAWDDAARHRPPPPASLSEMARGSYSAMILPAAMCSTRSALK